MKSDWSAGGVGWVQNERIFDAVLAPFGEVVLRAADLHPGHHVFDIGCGTGALLEHAVSVGAAAVGVDISEAMVDAARRRVPSATVVLADAQTTDLRAVAGAPPFDRVVSRFGVMFFEDPVAAFGNIRSAAAPGARLAFVCWRNGENPMFTLGNDVLTDRLESCPVAGDSAMPGPLAFGDDERVRTVLGDAGWADVDVEPYNGMCDYGIAGSDGVDERLAVVLSSRTGRAARAELEPRLGPDGWTALVEEVRSELRSHLVDGVLKFVGRVWLVRATNPG
ncbi:class I SAM-dependent methyltransferase [soil metagenome]